MSAEGAAGLRGAAARIDFSPVVPCVRRSDLLLVRATVDAMPDAGGWQPRLILVVERDGEPGFVFNQTRAPVRFWAIPQNTHRIETEVAGVTATGFAGPTGSGGLSAYLRWRSADVTYELSATLSDWLAEREFTALARDLMAASVGLRGR